MRSRFSVFFLIGAMPWALVHAADLAGTWQYEKAADYSGRLKNIPPPRFPTLQIANGKLTLSPDCVVAVRSTKYFYSDPFQALLKEGIEEPSLDKYLGKAFSFPALNKAGYYEADGEKPECNKPLREFFVSDNKLIVPFAGSAFYSFVRSDGQAGKAAAASPQLYGHKLSHLPFSMPGYSSTCLTSLPIRKGIPQSTNKCVPVYAPAIATPNGDALMQLIGTHDYQRGGARHADDYTNAFANKMHPIFIVLPPLKDVLVVRVDDLEPGENEYRDTMSGAFLAIKDGKVTDQLNDGYSVTTDYRFLDDDGKARYQLTDAGKFKKLN